MSVFHCACGFAMDDADEFGDHLRQAFARDDDIGADGHVHRELAGAGQARRACACGFATASMAEFDDHLLIVFVTRDGVGSDGHRHGPIGPSTPDGCGSFAGTA